MSEELGVTSGWIEIEFGDLFTLPNDDIVDGPFGSNLKASEYVSAGIPIARLQNIKRNQFVAKNIQYVTKRKAEELMRHTFVPDDILITKLGDPLGKACLAPASIDLGVLVADVVRARLTHQWVDRRFLCYQINADYIVEQFKDQTKGTTRPRVNLTKIRALRAKLCPLKEQTRIVEKLEELLSDLDAGVAELKAAQKKLGQYRQSLLKAAVEGALTAEWRKQNVPFETGAQLLDRILLERRARWEAKQLAKFKEQGKTPPKDWQKKYPEPVQLDTSDLPALPEGWVWASLEQLSQFVRNGVSKTPNTEGKGFPILRINAVRPMSVQFSEFKNIELPEAEAADYFIAEGDLLATRYNGSVDLLGVVGLVRGTPEKLLHPDKLIRMKPVIGGALGAWMELAANTGTSRAHIVSRVKTTAGQTGISGEDLKKMPVPLPSLNEQGIAVSLVDNRLSAVLQQIAAIEISLKQSTAQRQNILRAAFSGQLVPQDPTDEPASVLLERIRAERAAHAAVNKPRGRKVRAATA
ncbi:restriction endonuclease subunit S [Methylobacter sp.]|uniref:restriction endonuclease subunit S n=1 Tax=Methylobacter sp. TaxID=2051955 RepID=UPI003DA2EAA4